MESSADLTAFIEEEYTQEDEDKPPDCGQDDEPPLVLSARVGIDNGQIKNHWHRFDELNMETHGAFAPLFCG